MPSTTFTTSKLLLIFLLALLAGYYPKQPITDRSLLNQSSIEGHPALWVSTYHSTENKINNMSAMTVGSNDYVYATGYTHVVDLITTKDCTTIKIDPDGNQEWAVDYDGPGFGDNKMDECRDIAVDKEGYVYVTGDSYSPQNDDYITLRYKPDGTLDWERRYTYQDQTTFDQAYQLLLDDQYLYVTGIVKKGDSDQGIVTLTYDHLGNLIRERFHEGRIPHDIKTDPDGNIYIFAEPNFSVIKYDAEGNEVWSVTYDPSDYLAIPNTMVVDDDGNVFVTGKFWMQDFVTMKFDADGSFAWKHTYSSSGAPYDIAVDSENNIIVTGYKWTDGITNNDMVLIKYSNSGEIIWQKLFQPTTSDIATQLVLDGDDNIYVIGHSEGQGYHTFKYNSDGDLIFRYYRSDPLVDYPSKISLDSQNNILIGGTRSGDFIIVKYPPQPPEILYFDDAVAFEGNESTDVKIKTHLSRKVNYPVSFQYSTGNDSAIAGNDYISSTNQVSISAGELETDFNISIIKDEIVEDDKYFHLNLNNPTNVLLVNNIARITIRDDDRDNTTWIRRYNSGGDDDPAGLAIDDFNNIYVVVNFDIYTPKNYKSILVKYGPDGNQLWTQNYKTVLAKSLVLDKDGNPIIIGRSQNFNCAVIKYRPDGSVYWSKTFAAGGSWCDDVILDSTGNIVAVGRISTFTADDGRPIYDYLTLKYNSDGVLLWSNIFGVSLIGDDIAQQVLTDSQNNVYVAGYSSTSSGQFVTVIKYSAEGNLLWKTDINTNSDNNVVEMSMVNEGTIYLSTKERAFQINQDGTLIYSMYYDSDEVYSAVFTKNLGFVNTGYYDTSKYFWSNTNARRWYHGGHGEDIIFDQYNNFFVCGTIFSNATGHDFHTMAFDTDGNILWQQTLQGQGEQWGAYEIGEYIALDKNENVIVTGESQGDFQTIKYSPVVPLPLLSVQDAYGFRADTSSKIAFMVKLTRAFNHEISFDYSTIDWSAQKNRDFTEVTGTAVIPPNQTTYTIEVPILYGENPSENRELFIHISNLKNAFYKDSLGIGTIFGTSITHNYFPLLFR